MFGIGFRRMSAPARGGLETGIHRGAWRWWVSTEVLSLLLQVEHLFNHGLDEAGIDRCLICRIGAEQGVVADAIDQSRKSFGEVENGVHG